MPNKDENKKEEKKEVKTTTTSKATNTTTKKKTTTPKKKETVVSKLQKNVKGLSENIVENAEEASKFILTDEEKEQNIINIADIINKSITMLCDFNQQKIDELELEFNELLFEVKFKMSQSTYDILDKMLGNKIETITFGRIHAVLRGTSIIPEIDDIKDGVISCEYKVYSKDESKDLEFMNDPATESIDLNGHPSYEVTVNNTKFKDVDTTEVIKNIEEITNIARELKSVINKRSKDMTVEEWLDLPQDYSGFSNNYDINIDSDLKKVLFGDIMDREISAKHLQNKKETFVRYIRIIDEVLEKLKEDNIKRFKINKLC